MIDWFMNNPNLFGRIVESWSAETAFDPEIWSPECPSTGQCVPTALFIQEISGGTLARTVIDDVSHYFNVLDNGEVVDATIQQFENPIIEDVQARDRESLLANPDVRRRYELLKQRVSELTDVSGGTTLQP